MPEQDDMKFDSAKLRSRCTRQLTMGMLIVLFALGCGSGVTIVQRHVTRLEQRVMLPELLPAIDERRHRRVWDEVIVTLHVGPPARFERASVGEHAGEVVVTRAETDDIIATYSMKNVSNVRVQGRTLENR